MATKKQLEGVDERDREVLLGEYDYPLNPILPHFVIIDDREDGIHVTVGLEQATFQNLDDAFAFINLRRK